MKYCPNCGKENVNNSNFCSQCGTTLKENTNNENLDKKGKERLIAGLLGIIFGGIGVHNFYLGFTTKGVIQIIATIFTFGIASIWGFIEGIMILAGGINYDANGNKLHE